MLRERLAIVKDCCLCVEEIVMEKNVEGLLSVAFSVVNCKFHNLCVIISFNYKTLFTLPVDLRGSGGRRKRHERKSERQRPKPTVLEFFL